MSVGGIVGALTYGAVGHRVRRERGDGRGLVGRRCP